MATQLFKDGQSILIDPEYIQGHIDAGWSFDDPTVKVQRLEVIYPAHFQNMSEEEAEKAILKEMGIEIKHPEPVAQPKRRGRPRKAA
jgi:hypothetical protein